MDKRDLFLLLQKPPINIIPSPCFEHTVDFVAQLAPWVPFSPSLFSLDRNRLQSSKFPTCSSSRTAGSSRSRPSTPPLTGEPQTRGLLRSEQPTTDQPSSSSSSHLLLLDLALQNCSSCPPPHSIPFSVFARCLLYTTPPTLLFSDHPPLQLHFNHFWIPFWTL